MHARYYLYQHAVDARVSIPWHSSKVTLASTMSLPSRSCNGFVPHADATCVYPCVGKMEKTCRQCADRQSSAWLFNLHAIVHTFFAACVGLVDYSWITYPSPHLSAVGVVGRCGVGVRRRGCCGFCYEGSRLADSVIVATDRIASRGALPKFKG